MRKRTLEEINEIYHKQYSYIDVLEFEGYGKQSKLFCNVCKNIWSRQFGIHNCPNCSKKQKKIKYQNKYGQKYVKFLDEKNIDLLEEYIDNSTKIKHRCRTCNHEWKTTPATALQAIGKICPKCSGVYKMTEEEFLYELENRYPKQFIIKSNFTGLSNNIEADCLKCSGEISKTAHSLLENGCKTCSLNEINSQQFYEKLNNIFGEDIISESDYINSNTKMKFYKRSCNHHFCITPNHLLDRQNCPKCNKSIGEQRIEKFLIKNNIEYVEQKSFDDLRGIKNGLLPYDFYLPQYNLLIEFQGEQHDHPIEHFGGEEKFKIQQEHDHKKRVYSKLHNFQLLEIWYYDINQIEEILKQALGLETSSLSA